MKYTSINNHHHPSTITTMAASLESGVDDPQCEFDLKKALVLGGCAFEVMLAAIKAYSRPL